jgi:gluconate 2-dehydrogenase gamma chain
VTARGPGDLSRRELLVAGSLYGGGLWLALHLPAAAVRAEGPAAAPAVLTAAERRTLEAITARILPSDDLPGAREANCAGFIEAVLSGPDAAAVPLYRAGLAGADAAARARGGAAFAELAPDAADVVLAALEAGAAPGWPAGPVASPVFFETVRAHTLIGFLADPRWGGNRAFSGWRVVGYPGPRHHAGGYTPAQMLGQEKIRAVWGEWL